MHRQTPLGALIRGIVAGAIGTAAMDISARLLEVRRQDPRKDLSAHLVYGLGTAAAMRALSR